MIPLAVSLLVFYLGLCGMVALFQKRLVYVPDRDVTWSAGAQRLEREELTLVASDGTRLDACRFPVPDARGELLLCHGNAGDLADRVHLVHAFRAMGLAVTIFDYRGYGHSEGSPDEDGLYLDAEAAYRWLTGTHGVRPERLVLFGESLGSGVAIELATRHPVAALITESAFTSLPDVGAAHFPWLPVRLLLRQRFASIDRVASVRAPLLLIHSPEDELVPFTHAERLFAAAREPKTLLRTEGGHNDGGFVRRESWREQVAAFALAALPGG